jgi:photosystem II stability/assembly factor-like uncharacterized protein
MTHRGSPIVCPLVLAAATTLLVPTQAALAQSAVTLTHVHGLAYSADGKQLMVPSHHGLAVYAGGKWSMAPGPQHDYMGFAATRSRLYSSGHPAPGSGLVNPFGLIRSTDGGKSWDRLGLQGEADFHGLAAGWNTNAIYVWNPAPNSRMPRPGLHYTLNDGFQWQRAAASGLAGKPHALAAHPDDAKTVAVTTSAGVFLSRDAGASFKPVVRGEEGLAVYFDLDGKHLWYASYAGVPRLTRVALGSGETAPAILPALRKDAVAYIAQNPADRKEFAIATFERSIYISKDAGRNWTQVANRGQGR